MLNLLIYIFDTNYRNYKCSSTLTVTMASYFTVMLMHLFSLNEFNNTGLGNVYHQALTYVGVTAFLTAHSTLYSESQNSNTQLRFLFKRLFLSQHLWSYCFSLPGFLSHNPQIYGNSAHLLKSKTNAILMKSSFIPILRINVSCSSITEPSHYRIHF